MNGRSSHRMALRHWMAGWILSFGLMAAWAQDWERQPERPDRRPPEEPGRPPAERFRPDVRPDAPGPEADRPFPANRESSPERDVVTEVFSRFPNLDPKRMMESLRDTFGPEMRRFRELAAERREEAVDFLSRVIREWLDLQDIRRRRPESYEQHLRYRRLEREAEEQAAAARRAAPPEREDRLAGLRRTLEEAFDLKQKLLRGDVEHMEAEAARLRRRLEKRAENRAAIIERRLKELTGEGEDLAW